MKNKLFEIPYIKLILGFVLGSIIFSSVLGYYTPILINDLFEAVDKRSEFFYVITLLACIFGFEYINRVIFDITIDKLIQKLLLFVRSFFFDFWMNTYDVYFEKKKKASKVMSQGEILARVMNDTDAFRELVSSGFFSLFIDLVFILSCFIGLIKLNMLSGVGIVSFEVIACIFLFLGSKLMTKVFMQVRIYSADVSRVVANISAGFFDLYHTPHKNFAVNSSKPRFEKFLTEQLKSNFWDASYDSISESLFPITLIVLVFILPFSGLTEVAVLAAIIDLIQRSIGPIKEISGKISTIQRAKTGFMRLAEFYKRLETLPKVNKTKTFEVEKMKFNLKDFSYYNDDSQSVFKMNSIEIEFNKGERIGIVGKSGGGKSTFLKLLCGDILAVDSESKLIGSNQEFIYKSEIEKLSRYKKFIGVVSQDSFVFTETLKFNITMGDSSRNFDEFWNDIIKRIPYLMNWGMSPDSTVGLKNISSGQKQIIAILRSLYFKKPILFFDEISSSLDSDLELALRKLSEIAQKDAITITVAHRMETLMESDRILVIDRGQIEEDGAHKELLVSSALYQELFAQLK